MRAVHESDNTLVRQPVPSPATVPPMSLAVRVLLGLAWLACAAGCEGRSPECGDASCVDAGEDAGPDADDGAIPPSDAGVDAGPRVVFDGGEVDCAEPGPPCEGPRGLYVEGSCRCLAPGVVPYQPRYPLWSDDTAKSRYVFLPPDSQIDTSDPDAWIFPVGTRLYKDFLVDGVRIETRLLQKVGVGVGASAWTVRTYAWNAAQDAATPLETGREDALGTEHDIPAVGACFDCHTSVRPDLPLGLSAIQLAWDPPDPSQLSLARLQSEGWLTRPIELSAAAIPGTDDEREVLGYLHANCGSCHADGYPGVDLTLWVDVGTATVAQTGLLRAVGMPSGWTALDPVAVRVVEPGDPSASTLYRRMVVRERARVGMTAQMPPLATERVDPVGSEQVRVWIESLVP